MGYKESTIVPKYTMTLERPKKVREFSKSKRDGDSWKTDNHPPQNLHVKHHKIKVMDLRPPVVKPEQRSLHKFPITLPEEVTIQGFPVPVPAEDVEEVNEDVVDAVAMVTEAEERVSVSDSIKRGVTFKPSILVRHLGEEGLLGTESLPLEEDKNTAGRVKRRKHKSQDGILV